MIKTRIKVRSFCTRGASKYGVLIKGQEGSFDTHGEEAMGRQRHRLEHKDARGCQELAEAQDRLSYKASRRNHPC